jgi:Beta-galactosidase
MNYLAHTTTKRQIGTALGVLFVGLCLFAIALSITLPSNSRAASSTITLAPTADTFVDSTRPKHAYGDSSRLVANASPQILSFLRFEVQGTGQNSVSRARLRLYIIDASAKAGLKVMSTATNWDEATVTWNKQPTLGPRVAALAPIPMPHGQWIEIDLGQAVTGDGIYSFALTTDSTDRVAFPSRSQANAPQLVLTVNSSVVPPTSAPTAIPAPTAAATQVPPNGGTASKPDYPGIWGIWGTDVSKAGRPWLKGFVVTVGWDEIEPTNNQFAWTKLDAQVNKVASQDLDVMVLVYTGLHAPQWLYSNGVTEVRTDWQGGTSFPYYPGPEYKTLFKRMVAAVANHLQTAYSPTVRSKIIGVQGAVGASGDASPYKGNFLTGGTADLPPDVWQAFQKEMFVYYASAYATSKPKIHVLVNTGYDPVLNSWTVTTLPGIWLKTSRIGDRYQNDGEILPSNPSSFLPPYLRTFQNGQAIRARSEMDLTNQGWFKAAPLWNMYWTQLWGLHNGQDMHNQLDSDLTNPAYAPAFAFYSTYAGYKDPRDSTGAWIALHDGLDARDTARFPESQFGTASRTNTARYTAISRAYAPYGARQDDLAGSGATSFTALNDVGWAVYPGNFQMYLSQINPAGTSQGLWRVGPQDQPYGRFARRFDHASGKDRMDFNLDDQFLLGQPLNGAYPVRIRVVYLDQGTGQWALTYDAVGNSSKTAVVVTKTNTGRWKEQTVTISDGYFGNRGPNQADLSLVNVDGEDDTFHMIELTRATGYRTGYFGD